MNSLYRNTLLVLVAIPLALYLLTAIVLGGRGAIEIGNAGLLAFSAGIVVAYFPVVREALRSSTIQGGDILSVGIFLSWLGVLVARSGSILWRATGQDPSWLNSTLWVLHIAIATAGALCHLVAPETIAGRVPKRSWIRIGLWVALGVFVFTLLTLL